MATLTLRNVKGTPLTLNEVDNNFTALNDDIATKLNTSLFTGTEILTRLRTVDGAGSLLDADLLDGLNASSTLPTTTDKSSIVSRNSSGSIYATTLVGNVTGNLTGEVSGNVTGNLTGIATSANTLAIPRTIAISGDATWSVSFNATTNVSSALTLANTGVSPGTYTKLTVDSKGRATAGTSLTATDIHTALGYTTLSTSGKAADANLLDGYNSSIPTVAFTIPVRDGNGDITTNYFRGIATSAQYADLAEKYTTDKEYPIGTVMMICGDEDHEAEASNEFGCLSIGVISEKPAYLMNSESEGQAIALKGRVPVRVVGPIKKGQTVCATTNGAATFGMMNPIGIALKTDLSEDEKLVECVIL